MANVDDGGNAFPFLELDQETGGVCAQHLGLSKRDWFAGQALAGIAADWPTSPDNLAKAAQLAYSLADLMIAERAKS